MLLDIPRFKCFVKSQYVTDYEISNKYIEAYAFSVTILENRPILFTVHTIDGAVYSRLPVWALCTIENPSEKLIILDKWGAISSSGNIIEHKYLRDYKVKLVNENLCGQYAFTIDYDSGGFSQDPEQHKTSNVIFWDNGQIGINPNNELLFIDSHFTKDPENLIYRRNKTYYTLD